MSGYPGVLTRLEASARTRPSPLGARLGGLVPGQQGPDSAQSSGQACSQPFKYKTENRKPLKNSPDTRILIKDTFPPCLAAVLNKARSPLFDGSLISCTQCRPIRPPALQLYLALSQAYPFNPCCWSRFRAVCMERYCLAAEPRGTGFTLARNTSAGRFRG